MQVIRDDELSGPMMIPLMVDWHISKSCQIAGCDAPTTTIICTTADESQDGKPHQLWHLRGAPPRGQGPRHVRLFG